MMSMHTRCAPLLLAALWSASAQAGVVHGNPNITGAISPTTGWSSAVSGIDGATITLTRCGDSSTTTVSASSGTWTLPTGSFCGFEIDWADTITVYATGPGSRVVDVEIQLDPLSSSEAFSIDSSGGDALIVALGNGSWLSVIEANLAAGATLEVGPGDAGHDAIRDRWSNARVVIDSDGDGAPDQAEWQAPLLVLD